MKMQSHQNYQYSINVPSTDHKPSASFKVVPIFVPDTSIHRAWFTVSFMSPAYFHGLAFAGAFHKNLLQRGVMDTETPAGLYHKVLAIRELAKVVSNPTRAMQDDIMVHPLFQLSFSLIRDMRSLRHVSRAEPRISRHIFRARFR